VNAFKRFGSRLAFGRLPAPYPPVIQVEPNGRREVLELPNKLVRRRCRQDIDVGLENASRAARALAAAFLMDPIRKRHGLPLKGI
jgi:hypothetical protein